MPDSRAHGSFHQNILRPTGQAVHRLSDQLLYLILNGPTQPGLAYIDAGNGLSLQVRTDATQGSFNFR